MYDISMVVKGGESVPASWHSHLAHVVAAQNGIEEHGAVTERAHCFNGLAQG